MNNSNIQISELKSILDEESGFLDDMLKESRGFLIDFGKKVDVLPIEELLNSRQEIIKKLDPLMKMHKELFEITDEPLPIVIELLKQEIQKKVNSILKCDSELVNRIIKFRMLKTNEIMVDQKNIKYFQKDADTRNKQRISSTI
ncbi:MAG: hypothetical protein HN729_06680 [Candidatus Marinimicrobia bacterium]|jgi:hypothetical protein|nr:hypothetical protein [Candidatus Neomarinimicrobiota bacterium]MBT3633693.1 hypothetical protein [Candidatus Neomarinimicrobiota bacterium]MBT3682354.1 hypothetical protein [Candidatus Neomarinimicrobiota bacterium]MBT3759118.1 hypothetical protein [Candidatus Neomarinimicrobiota bacterium]MBT3895609.1 hypothetical protein [Candidatus Neomarinimicrobiota bacterium]